MKFEAAYADKQLIIHTLAPGSVQQITLRQQRCQVAARQQARRRARLLAVHPKQVSSFPWVVWLAI